MDVEIKDNSIGIAEMIEQKANFILPGLYEHHALNLQFLELLRTHPEWFYDGVNVSAVYGSFQFCIFDGGRNFIRYRHTTKEEIERITQAYNDFGVPIRLVFTNTELQPEHYYNRFGNVIMSVCENDMNEIVINNEGFENYVRENYPGFQFISSTTKCLNTPQGLKDELAKDKYKMVCLDYNLNHNMKILEEFPMDVRARCEFLVNAICPPGCPQRKEHYKLNSLYHLSYGKSYSMANCQIRENTLHPVMVHSRNNLTPEEIYSTYVPMGYNLFKLEGRTLSSIENICNYVRYMVKPEYQFMVISLLVDDDCSTKMFKTLFAN